MMSISGTSDAVEKIDTELTPAQAIIAALKTIARGSLSQGRPLSGVVASGLAREALVRAGIDW